MLKFFIVLINLLSFSCRAMETCTKMHHTPTNSKNHEYLLACNISKTSTTLGIFTQEDQKLSLLLELSRKTTDITDFTQFIANLISDFEKNYEITIERACFGVPGNPSAQQNFIQPFNISFAVDAQSIQAQTNLKQIYVVNDFEVIGYGIDTLDAHSIIQVNAGIPRNHWPKVVVGAGDGLGSCLMVWDSAHNNYRPSPLGFCYTDFAPREQIELDLVNYIIQTSEMKNVSWGYLLGLKGGIKKMYEFLNTAIPYIEPFVSYTTPQEIFTQALNNARCKDAVALYMKLYIQLLRNVAYALLPYGGLYITNSVIEKNQELFSDESFFTEMLNCNNELLSALIKEIPMYGVIEPKVKLFGAARYILVQK